MSNTATGVAAQATGAHVPFECYEGSVDILDGIAIVAGCVTVLGMAVSTGVLYSARKSHSMALFVKPGLLAWVVLTCAVWILGQLLSSVHLRWPALQGTFGGCTVANRLLPGVFGEGLTITLVLYRLYDVSVVHIQHSSATNCLRFWMAWPLLTQVVLTMVAFLEDGAMERTGCDDVACVTSPRLGTAIFVVYVSHLLVLMYFARMSRALWAMFVESNTLFMSGGFVAAFLLAVAIFAVFFGPTYELTQFAFTASVLLTINAVFFCHVGATLLAVMNNTTVTQLFSAGPVVTYVYHGESDAVDKPVATDTDTDVGADVGAGVGECKAGVDSESAFAIGSVDGTTSDAGVVGALRTKWTQAMVHHVDPGAPGAPAAPGANQVATFHMAAALANPIERAAFLAYVRPFNAYLVDLCDDVQQLMCTAGRRNKAKRIRDIRRRYLNRSFNTDTFIQTFRGQVYCSVQKPNQQAHTLERGRIHRLTRAPGPRTPTCWTFSLDTIVRMPLDAIVPRGVHPYLPAWLTMPRPAVCWPGPAPLTAIEALDTDGVDPDTRSRMFDDMPISFLVHGVPEQTATSDPEAVADVDVLKEIELRLRHIASAHETILTGNTTLFASGPDGEVSDDPVHDIQEWAYDFLLRVYWGPYVRQYHTDIYWRCRDYTVMRQRAMDRGFVAAPIAATASMDQGDVLSVGSAGDIELLMSAAQHNPTAKHNHTVSFNINAETSV